MQSLKLAAGAHERTSEGEIDVPSLCSVQSPPCGDASAAVLKLIQRASGRRVVVLLIQVTSNKMVGVMSEMVHTTCTCYESGVGARCITMLG